MIANNWPKVPIQEIYLGFYDGPHATPKPAEDGAIFLGIKNITEDGRLDLSQIRWIAEDDFPRWTKRVTPQENDIVFSYEATLHRYAMIPVGFRGCLGRRLALIRPDPERIDPRFLFYYFFGDEWESTIAQNLIFGATVERIPLIHFPEFEISLPPPPTQRKIAAVLSAYDDLIENNTRRIAILEEMAQALYREWFVHFRFPGHESVPLIESDLGPVPEGWEVVMLGDVCKIGRGSSPRPIKDQRYFEGGTIPWIKIADATSSGRYLYETKQYVNEFGASFSRRLPRGSLILAASGTLGHTQFLGVEGCIHDGWLYFEDLEGVDRFYLYQLFRDRQQYFYNAAYGAAIQNVNTMILREMQIILPPPTIQQRFRDFVVPLDQQIDTIARKNTTLRQTRDLLLPRLISGEVDVSALEIVGVEE